MKTTIKKTLAIVLALALALTAIGCSVAYAESFRGEGKKSPVTAENTPATDIPAAPQMPTAATPNTPAPSIKELISRDKAEALARESLGIANLHLSGIELDDGRYELDFCDGSTEYDVEVHATNGTILKSQVDHYDECDRCDKDWDDHYDDWDDDWDDHYDDWDDRYDD